MRYIHINLVTKVLINNKQRVTKMDTKKILLISLIAVAILASVSAVSAGWFGPDTIECKQFSIEIPEGYHKSSEWTDNLFDDFLYIWVMMTTIKLIEI